MQAYNWSQFKLRIPVNADKKSIYAAWSSQQGLESWFLRKAEFTKADGSQRAPSDMIQIADNYLWMWHGWPDEVTEKGVILQENGTDLVKFSFGPAGKVTITITEEEGQSMINLVQDEIPTDDHSKTFYHIGCTKGWVFYLANLKSILEGGIDLRNKNVALSEVINS